MPRASKGPRLYLKPAEYRDGRIRKAAVWVVRDGARVVVTGCAQEDRAGAEQALADYLARKHAPEHRRDQAIDDVLVTDVLHLYAEEVVPSHARPDKSLQRLLQLGEWWVGKTLADVTGRTCRAYVAWRTRQAWKSARPEKTGNAARMVTAAGVRRELEDLRAAINHHRREGYCRAVVEVWMPPKSPPRVVFLERDEAARLLWHCWRMREVQTHGDREVVTRKAPWRHLARFILVGLYTGTRAGSIASAGFERAPGVAWIDLEGGVFHRLPVGKVETAKRQPPARIPSRLLAHVRRWHRQGIARSHVVEWNGRPVGEVNKGFAAAVRAAGLPPEVTPHALRHTAATWLMRAGCDLWEAAGYLGMTPETLQRVYGHHHPDHQAEAVESIGRGGKKRKAG